MVRTAEIVRNTKETQIQLKINLDGDGVSKIDTGLGFFNHMLTLLSAHSKIDLELTVHGDLDVDGHHTVEDVGIALGQAVAKALGDKRGIVRFGTSFVPMDESLIQASLDISGRGQLHFAIDVPMEMLGIFNSSLAKEFFIAFAQNAGITLHLIEAAGENTHHIIEAAFKACGRALCDATRINPRVADALPSTKGML